MSHTTIYIAQNRKTIQNELLLMLSHVYNVLRDTTVQSLAWLNVGVYSVPSTIQVIFVQTEPNAAWAIRKQQK